MSDVPPEKVLYIPAEKLNDNVKRMAWLLFLEWWKDAVREGGMEKGLDGELVMSAYTVSVATAKGIWSEQEASHERV